MDNHILCVSTRENCDIATVRRAVSRLYQVEERLVAPSGTAPPDDTGMVFEYFSHPSGFRGNLCLYLYPRACGPSTDRSLAARLAPLLNTDVIAHKSDTYGDWYLFRPDGACFLGPEDVRDGDEIYLDESRLVPVSFAEAVEESPEGAG
jgi:hypothetical protein